MTNFSFDSLRALVTRTSRPARFLVAGLALAALASCAKGDVGAPCNHGKVEPPQSKLVTFPALSCNELLCVYADSDEPPETACTSADQCNVADPGVNRFTCDTEAGRCQLRIEYVLERSMCSKRCSSDADCKDGGPTEKVVVDNTKCASGFSCARIQTLGEFCCEKLCVCRDDLDDATVAEINMDCSTNMQQGCCTGLEPNQMPSDACGKP
jgi:hypothetical protein